MIQTIRNKKYKNENHGQKGDTLNRRKGRETQEIGGTESGKRKRMRDEARGWGEGGGVAGRKPTIELQKQTKSS